MFLFRIPVSRTRSFANRGMGEPPTFAALSGNPELPPFVYQEYKGRANCSTRLEPPPMVKVARGGGFPKLRLRQWSPRFRVVISSEWVERTLLSAAVDRDEPLGNRPSWDCQADDSGEPSVFAADSSLRRTAPSTALRAGL